MNYNKPTDDNMKKVAIKYAPDKDILLIMPLQTESQSKVGPILIFLLKNPNLIFGGNICQKYLVGIFATNI